MNNKTLSVVEKQALMKLPMRLRVMLAPLFEWPELGVDRRGKHWREKAAMKMYRVHFEDEKKTHECTLEQAAAMVGWNAKALDEALAKPARGYGRRGVDVTTRAGVVRVTKVTTS